MKINLYSRKVCFGSLFQRFKSVVVSQPLGLWQADTSGQGAHGGAESKLVASSRPGSQGEREKEAKLPGAQVTLVPSSRSCLLKVLLPCIVPGLGDVELEIMELSNSLTSYKPDR